MCMGTGVWRVQVQGEDRLIAPATPKIKQINKAIKQIYNNKTRRKEKCSTVKETMVRYTIRCTNWRTCYTKRPKKDRDKEENMQHHHHCEQNTHPGWREIHKRNEMRVYTDGSYRPDLEEGTYAWVAGWHDADAYCCEEWSRCGLHGVDGFSSSKGGPFRIRVEIFLITSYTD